MELQTVVLYGKAGSGKGTQAKLLKEYLEKNDPEHPVLYIETGAVFREFATQDNFTAKMVKQVLKEGGLLPEFLPVWVWTSLFIKHITGSEHIILDGLARNEDEVPVLARALQFYNRPSTAVILLQVSDKTVLERLSKRARSDDFGAEVKKRLLWFEKNVLPAVARWEQFPKAHVHEIDSEGSIEMGHTRVLKALKLSG